MNMLANNQVAYLDYERILRAARELFTKKGFISTNILDIVAETRLPEGRIYRYFFTKEEIAIAIIKTEITFYITGIHQFAKEVKSTDKEGLERFTRRYQKFMVQYPYRHLIPKLMFDCTEKQKYLQVALQDFYSKCAQELSRLFPEAIDFNKAQQFFMNQMLYVLGDIFKVFSKESLLN